MYSRRHMLRLAIILSIAALAISLVVLVPTMLSAKQFSVVLFSLLPIAAFALAVAAYLRRLSNPWHLSFTWLFNGIVAMYLGFSLLFMGFFVSREHPTGVVIVVMVALFLPAFLNSILLYPTSPKRQIER